MPPLRGAAKPPNNSFDAEDDLDTDLAEELARFRTPEAWGQVAQHLDLVWKIGRVRHACEPPSPGGAHTRTGTPPTHGPTVLLLPPPLFTEPRQALHVLLLPWVR